MVQASGFELIVGSSLWRPCIYARLVRFAVMALLRVHFTVTENAVDIATALQR